MKRWLLPVGVALALAFAATAAAGDSFVVVDGTAPVLPSAQTPNPPGSVTLPPELLVPPAFAEQLSSDELQALWQQAGAAYGIPWPVLAAVNQIESDFGRNMGPSSAGAIGWMQFMPDTWLRWGLDADGDGLANPWDAEDAVYAAARYLAASGGSVDVARALFAYNHADWYVAEVLAAAQEFAAGGGFETPLVAATLGVDADAAEARAAELREALAAAEERERRLASAETLALARVAPDALLSERLATRKRAIQIGVRHQRAIDAVERLRSKLADAEAAATEARAGALASTFSNGLSVLPPASSGSYAFPVAGGPELVSVAHTHHDYPAADIAAPEGSALYALTDGVVVRGWALPEGRCGIGFTMAAADGRRWTYCHLSLLEPTVTAGAILSAGQPVGLVGATGTTASGPHLHLQLAPPVSYPQAEEWFQSFAGSAFRWSDSATSAPVAGSHAVFSVVPDTAAQPEVVLFSSP